MKTANQNYKSGNKSIAASTRNSNQFLLNILHLTPLKIQLAINNLFTNKKEQDDPLGAKQA
jgi:hypothetical protein